MRITTNYIPFFAPINGRCFSRHSRTLVAVVGLFLILSWILVKNNKRQNNHKRINNKDKGIYKMVEKNSKY